MKTLKRMFCVALVFSLLISLFALPAGAVAPGNPWNEDISQLYEMKYGHALDRVLVYMHTMEIKSYPFYNDPQVDRIIQSDMAIIFELDDEGTLPVNAAPGDTLYYSVVYLNTKDEESLNAFIEKYKNAEGVALIETDGLGYIPETRWAILITLDFISDNGDLLPDVDFTPAFFSEKAVKAVYTVPFGESAVFVRDIFIHIPEDDSAYDTARRKGVPCKAVLELKDNNASPAAAFALELIDFEHSDLFTDEQKEQFRNRLSDIELVAYDACTGEEPLKTLAQSRTVKVWTVGDVDLDAALPKHDAVCIATDGYYSIWYVSGSGDLKTLAGLLENTAGVVEAKVFDGVTLIGEQTKDMEAGHLMRSSTLAPGDADCDGKVTVADARAALRCAIGLGGLSYEGFYAADTDGDKEITTADARNLLRAAIGITDAKNLCFTLPVNHTLLLGPLRSYHDGGYLWSLTVTEGDETQLSVSERTADILPPLEGNGAYTVFAVTGRKPGTYKVHIECKRPWDDGENRVLEEYDIVVNVI